MDPVEEQRGWICPLQQCFASPMSRQLLALQASSSVVGVAVGGPDESLIACGTDVGVVHVWNRRNGHKLGTFSKYEQKLKYHGGPVAVAKDGNLVVSASGSTVFAWCVKSGACSRELRGHTGAVTSLAITSAGDRIASASEDGTVRIWATRSGKCEFVLRHPEDEVLSIIIRSDGCRLMSVSGNRKGRTTRARVYAVGSNVTAICERTLDRRFVVISVAIAEDANSIIVGTAPSELVMWALDSNVYRVLDTEVSSTWRNPVATTRDGSIVVSGSDSVIVSTFGVGKQAHVYINCMVIQTRYRVLCFWMAGDV